MNKKQLIVAWVMGILISFLCFIGLGKKIPALVHLRLLDYPVMGEKWAPTVSSYLIVSLIVGSLLIYTLRDKKK